MQNSVAFLGLGVMGSPMAGHLASAGHAVTVYNRTPAKAEQWQGKHRGAVAPTPSEAAKDKDIVFACVGNDDDVRQITIGENGAFAAMKPGAIFVDHTTTSASIARELYDIAKAQGLNFLDAPISGGQAGAENAALTVMVGGDEDVFDRTRPVIDAYARTLGLIGGPGAGQLAKMVNQIAIAGLVQGLAEALNFGGQAGLDMDRVIAAISQGAASSWQMQNRYQSMLAGEFEFGFAVDWMRKDLKNCFEEAQRNGAELPITRLIDGYYAEVQEAGGNRWDTSSLLTRLGKK